MKEINISFKELIDYVKDKDFELHTLESIARQQSDKIKKLEEENYLISDWLYNHGITLAIERNKVIEIPRKEGENNDR